jgi:xanthine dehydrogenase/oxidase
MSVTDDGVLVGASVTLTHLLNYFTQLISSLPSHQTGVIKAVIDMLKMFAGYQIRNVSSLAGNIITASPISDMNPILLATGCVLNLSSVDGKRAVKVDSSFFTDYRKTALSPNEVLVSVVFPFTNKNEHVMIFKQSRRREDDIAIVNACMLVKINEDDMTVKSCNLAFGGMSKTTIMAHNTQTALKERVWNKDLLEFGCGSLAEELVLPPTVPGGMPVYRLSLCLSFFYKFYLSVLKQYTPDTITHQLSSAIEVYDKPVSKSSQGFKSISKGNRDTIGQPLMHLSAEKQVTGEAKYIDDLPHYENELYAGLVLSERAHAEFTLDTQALDGINDEVYIVTADDVPGSNDGTGVFKDEQVFRKGSVTSVGQIIAIVLAGNKSLAQQYAKLIKVNYTELTPVLTIEDSIKEQQFHPENNPIHRRLSCGDVQSALSCSELTVEGTMRTGGQEHFYLETIVCIAVPKGEDGAMEIIASTQGPLETQLWAAKALGVDGNKVVAKVKRIGKV